MIREIVIGFPAEPPPHIAMRMTCTRIDETYAREYIASPLRLSRGLASPAQRGMTDAMVSARMRVI